MDWCRQATSHYLNQCSPRSMSPYGVTRPQWVKNTRYQDHACFLINRLINSLRPSVAICSGAKPLAEQMWHYYKLDPLEQTFQKLQNPRFIRLWGSSARLKYQAPTIDFSTTRVCLYLLLTVAYWENVALALQSLHVALRFRVWYNITDRQFSTAFTLVYFH